MGENLVTPPEPVEIRTALRVLLETQGPSKYIVFAGNKLPKYLWDNWSKDLKKMGLKWQDLLQSLSRHAGEALDWIAGRKRWEDFARLLAEDLEAKARGEVKIVASRRLRTLTDYL